MPDLGIGYTTRVPGGPPLHGHLGLAYHRDGALPDGLKATKNGATLQGVISRVTAWEIRLAKV